MLRLFFYLRVILFSSCLANYLGIGYNKIEKIAEAHKKGAVRLYEFFTTDKDKNKSDSVSLVDVIKYLKERYVIDPNDPNQKINFRIFDPFHFMLWDHHCINITTKLTDFSESYREGFLELLKVVIIINGHTLIGGMEPLSYYVDDKQSLNEPTVKNVFMSVEAIVSKAQMRYKNGAMLGDVMNQAFHDITESLKALKHAIAKEGIKFDSDAQAQLKSILESFLTGYRCSNEVMKTVFDLFKKKTLAIAYTAFYYKEKFESLDITYKVVHLFHKIGNRGAAEFYNEVVTIFQIFGATATEDEVKEKIDEAFRKALETPTKSVDELVQDIEIAKITSLNTPARKSFGSKTPKRYKKISKKKGQNPSSKYTNKVPGYSEKIVPSTLDKNKKAPQKEEKENGVLLSVPDLQKDFEKCGYTFHPRVSRWSEAQTDHVRKKFGGYEDLSEEGIKLQIIFHKMLSVALLLADPDSKQYFINTPKGKSAFAKLELEGTTYEGIFEMGISQENCIYHLFFNDKVKHKVEQLFQIIRPKFEDLSENNEAAGPWCNKDGCTIEKKGDILVCTMDMPTSVVCSSNQSSIKLHIYPNKFMQI